MILDGTHRFGGESLPAAVDWCAAGACNAILDENQHGCYGACWAFSAVAAIESAHFIASGRLLKLSEQQMMDCAGKAFGNAGCDGGQMRGAFNYAAKSGEPLCLERGYEYFGPLGPCRASSCGVGPCRRLASTLRRSRSDRAQTWGTSARRFIELFLIL